MLESMETNEISVLTMPAMALRGVTVFPDMTIHFEVEREMSLRALEQAMEKSKQIFLVTQRDISQDQVGEDDLYEIGCISVVKQVLRLPGDNARVMAEGVTRGRLSRLVQLQPYLNAEVEELYEQELTKRDGLRAEVLLRRAYELFQEYAEVSGKVNGDVVLNVLAARDPGWLADYIAQSIPLRFEDKQTVLSELNPCKRLECVDQILRREVQVMRLDREIQSKVHDRVNESQKEYYLREELKLIKEELGEGDSGDDEIQEYAEKIEKADLPKDAAEKLKKSWAAWPSSPSVPQRQLSCATTWMSVWSCLGRSRRRSASIWRRPERFSMRTISAWKRSNSAFWSSLRSKKMAPDLKGQIICLVGPPGVGKTSIAASVAKALNRKMARVSLGGVRDEAEIRGHRKTYIGACPAALSMRSMQPALPIR